MPCGFLSFTDDGTIAQVNATLLELLGYEAESLVGKKIAVILPIASRIFYQTHFFPLLKMHGRAEEIYFSLRSKPGKDIPMLVNGVRREVESPEGNSFINHCIFVRMSNRIQYEDELLKAKKAAEAAVEAQKQAEQALQQLYQDSQARAEELAQAYLELQNTQARLIQAEKMSSLGQLVAGIAHEINNPISFIYGNIKPATEYAQELASLVREYQAYYPNPPSTIADHLEDINLDYLITDFSKLLHSMKQGASRIRDIVKSLRTFSRLDESGIKAVHLADNLESTLMLLQNRLSGHGGLSKIQVTKRYGDLPLVECYSGLLNQALINVLNNAIEAIQTRWTNLQKNSHRDRQLSYIGTITITTSLEPGDRIVILIEDNGCGMTAEVQEKIFNPFFTTKPVGQGTGMGLATSYQIITETHQGSLTCASLPQFGSKFRIELPRSIQPT